MWHRIDSLFPGLLPWPCVCKHFAFGITTTKKSSRSNHSNELEIKTKYHTHIYFNRPPCLDHINDIWLLQFFPGSLLDVLNQDFHRIQQTAIKIASVFSRFFWNVRHFNSESQIFRGGRKKDVIRVTCHFRTTVSILTNTNYKNLIVFIKKMPKWEFD